MLGKFPTIGYVDLGNLLNFNFAYAYTFFADKKCLRVCLASYLLTQIPPVTTIRSAAFNLSTCCHVQAYPTCFCFNAAAAAALREIPLIQ